MHIVLTGGTGFLGQLLTTRLLRDGHTVTILTRGPAGKPGIAGTLVTWTPDGSVGSWAGALDGVSAVVNLAGESIAGHRWTAAHKHRIRESRVLATRSIVAAISRAARPPDTLINGSAVGYYGPRGDEVITEEIAAGSDFLGRVAADWEAEAMRAEGKTRVVRIRTGIVLSRDGGALPKMLPPFWFGAGGPVGSGRQYWPWVHWQDWVDLVRFALENQSATGAINVTAPNPVTNKAFAQALGRVLHRPAFMPTPGIALKLMLGEMADALLLSGQRVVPAKAERLGFNFTFKEVEHALRSALGK
jgi:uncharacterized protein (TIGR01777 family)